MKIFSLVNNYKTSVGIPFNPDWMLLPDSAMIRSGKPVFLPDDDEPFVMLPSLCIRIDKLGKHISEKFASRYFNEVAPAVQFMPLRALEMLNAGNTPSQQLTIFDNAIIIGDFVDYQKVKASDHNIILNLTAEYNPTESHPISKCMKWESCNMVLSLEQTIPLISKHNTLKTGDFMMAALPPQSLPATHPASIEMNGASGLKLQFRIR